MYGVRPTDYSYFRRPVHGPEASYQIKVGRHEQRLAEERERRWWAAERHKEPPPAYLQLERVYKTIVKGLKAKLELSEARRSITGRKRCTGFSSESRGHHVVVVIFSPRPG